MQFWCSYLVNFCYGWQISSTKENVQLMKFIPNCAELSVVSPRDLSVLVQFKSTYIIDLSEKISCNIKKYADEQLPTIYHCKDDNNIITIPTWPPQYHWMVKITVWWLYLCKWKTFCPRMYIRILYLGNVSHACT